MADVGQKATAPGGAGVTRSMTGFADAAGEAAPWKWTMELRGVNGRGLDIRIRAPEWVEGFEAAARKKLQAAVSRGSVTLNLRVAREVGAEGMALNEEALRAALATIAKVESEAERAGLVLRDVSAAEILTLRGVTDVRDDSAEVKPLARALDAALTDLIAAFDAARAAEGEALAHVLSDKIDEVDRLTEAAASAAEARTADQREALRAALTRLLDVTQVPDEDRMMQEMAVIAVKTDVTEEIDRLLAHVGAARILLLTPGAVGRKFDFLMQEFNREANTLCSKSQSPALTSIGLDLKTLIDQMREQVQNIE